MKNRIKILLLLGTCLILAKGVFAEDLICQNPYQMFCENFNQKNKIYKDEINKIRLEIVNEAKIKANIKISEMKKEISIFRFMKRKHEEEKIKINELMNSIFKKTGELESTFINDAFIEKVKGYFFKAIESSNFENNIKSKMKGLISAVKITSFSNFINRVKLDDAAIRGGALLYCGLDGLEKNAVTVKVLGINYVVICPGHLLEIDRKLTEKERIDYILQPVAHELAHNVDNAIMLVSQNKTIYSQFLDCIHDNYYSELNRLNGLTFECAKRNIDSNDCSRMSTMMHGNEIVADKWAVKVLNIRAEEEKYTMEEKLNLYKFNYESFCGTIDEGFHPTGEFRVNNLLKPDHSFRKTMSCDQGNEEIKNIVSCDF